MRSFPFLVALLVAAACGGRTESTSREGGEKTPAGLVQCGDRLCNVGDGNQCYFCEKSIGYQCHTLDLPTSCDSPVRIECDGDDDCRKDLECVEDCGGGPCSVPARECH